MKITLELDIKENINEAISECIDTIIDRLNSVSEGPIKDIKVVSSDKKEEIKDGVVYRVCSEEKARPGCSFYIQFSKENKPVYEYKRCTIIDYDQFSKKYLVAVNPSKSFMPARDGGYLWVSASQIYEIAGKI